MGASAVDYVVETKGRTAQQIWDQLSGQAGYESGHSYSGDLGSKHGFVEFRLPNASKEALQAIPDLMYQASEDDDEVMTVGDGEFAETTWCPARCQQGKVTVKVRAHVREVPEILLYNGQPDPKQWLPPAMLKGTVDATVMRDCRICKGTGQVPMEKDKVAEVRAKKKARQDAIKGLAGLPVRQAYEIYDDKWGPALLVTGKDHTFVGGYCSS
jgi:hypothetical protein